MTFRRHVVFFINITILILFVISTHSASAALTSGGNYTVENNFSEIGGVRTGGGYTIGTGGDNISGVITGNGYTTAVGGAIPQVIQQNNSGGGGGGGGRRRTAATTTQNQIPDTGGVKSGLCGVNTQTYLSLGSYGESVRVIQTFLNSYEDETLLVSGYFGTETEMAVKRFQDKYRADILMPQKILNPTGIWASYSSKKAMSMAPCLNTLVEPVGFCLQTTKHFSYGMVDPEIRIIQQFLNTYMFESLNVNGIFDRPTESAVMRYQGKYAQDILYIQNIQSPTGIWASFSTKKAHEIAPCIKGSIIIPTPTTTPVVNPVDNTANVITGITPTPVESTELKQEILPEICDFNTNIRLERGDMGADVLAVQRYLRTIEGMNIVESGIFDEMTISAVKLFQYTYRNVILEPQGFAEPTGIWASYSTRTAQIASDCPQNIIFTTTSAPNNIFKFLSTVFYMLTAILG